MSIKELYWKIVPYDWRPHQIWYRLKCFFWHRYTTVKPRTMPWNTWTDRGDLLPHVMFEILRRFLEEECSPGHIDWDADDKHRDAMKEMRRLYRWWNERYVPTVDHVYDEWHNFMNQHCSSEPLSKLIFKWDYPEHEAIGKKLKDAANENERMLQDELKANCKSMIDIMDFMWT